MTPEPTSVMDELDRYILWMNARARPDDAALIESIRARVAALVEAVKEMQSRSHLSVATKERRSMSVPEQQFLAVCDALRELGR